MASSSMSTRTSNVCLSYKDENFTGRLIAMLTSKGIQTHSDATKESFIAIIVLSKNYADSSSRLAELVRIMESATQIYPVFYHVYPSDVRHQRGSFELGQFHGGRSDEATIEKWKSALTKFADMKGYVVEDVVEEDAAREYEDEVVGLIVSDVLQTIRIPDDESFKRFTYDVFLSFAADTRKGFGDYLYTALRRNGLEVFWVEKLNNSKTDHYYKAIGDDARIAILVFSLKSACTECCLRDVAMFVERGKIIIPVFYDVQDYHVKELKGSFGEAFHNFVQGVNDSVKQASYIIWEEALKEAASYSGDYVVAQRFVQGVNDSVKQASYIIFEEALKEAASYSGDYVVAQRFVQGVKDSVKQASYIICEEALKEAASYSGDYVVAQRGGSRYESEVIESIVSDVLKIVTVTGPFSLPRKLVGIESKISDMTQNFLKLFQDVDHRIVQIHGIAGLGKTTFAKAVYNRIYSMFDASIFIDEIGRAKANSRSISLQKELLKTLVTDQSPDQIISTILHWRKRRVLIVLDDDIDPGDGIIGALNKYDLNEFHPGSRIIITTSKEKERQKDIRRFTLSSLDLTESVELLRFHAFEFVPMQKGFEKVPELVARAIGGSPLKIELIAKRLRDESPELWLEMWKELDLNGYVTKVPSYG